MKKTLLYLIFALSALAATAQHTQRGNFVIGSRIGFSAAKSSIDVQSGTTPAITGDGGSSTQFNLAPGIGYFFANNVVMGISMDWLKTSTKSGIDLGGVAEPTKTTDNNVLLFGPFARVFFHTAEDKAFFLGATAGFGNSKNEFIADNVSQQINNNLLNLGVGPGFTIFSKNGLALEALVKYNFARSVSDIDIQGVKRVSKTWTNAVDFSVGIQYYFGGFRPVN